MFAIFMQRTFNAMPPSFLSVGQTSTTPVEISENINNNNLLPTDRWVGRKRRIGGYGGVAAVKPILLGSDKRFVIRAADALRFCYWAPLLLLLLLGSHCHFSRNIEIRELW